MKKGSRISMENFKYVYGPIPSRRLGNSLGVSPIPNKTCNYSCIYCQLGRTNKMTNQRREFIPLADILQEFQAYLQDEDKFDVVTIVGEGEPTLYSRLGELISSIKALTDKPVAVITNASLLNDPQVAADLLHADIVLPSLDAYDEASFKKIDRPYGHLDFQAIYQGLIDFSHAFQGQLWAEIMLIDNINDDEESLAKFAKMLEKVRIDRIYINTPVRPPAESYVKISSSANIQKAVEKLSAISIEMLSSGSFFSEIEDDYQAILSIIQRHPMNQHEITSFLKSRQNPNPDNIIEKLKNDQQINSIDYKGYTTFRFK
ncbi:MAG: radical SAM protein [Clostridiales bacterium]